MQALAWGSGRPQRSCCSGRPGDFVGFVLFVIRPGPLLDVNLLRRR